MGGLLRDASTALIRYYNSKFSDGVAQDSLSLWANHFVARVDKPSPFARSRRDYCLNQPMLVDEDTPQRRVDAP